MKNLRKVLAVVLAVVMAFSLMAVASAKQVADYSDTASVKYTEAVDLVSGLGIMTGSSDTTFDPAGTFTREQAAKVICYLLVGTTVAGSLTATTNSFKDVESTRWSAPFIEYCAVNGIINGTGDGKFNPTAPVTGSAFAKMVLTALGYGAKGEYVGANWELNTLIKAQGLGILDTGVNYSASATREQVAKYAFNALTKCKPVTYNTVTGTYSNTYTYTKLGAGGATVEDSAKNMLGYATFKLLKTDLLNTYYGALSHYWKAYTTTVPATVSGTYADDTVLYTNTMGYPFNLTNVKTPNSGFYKVSLESNVKYYLNGVEVTDLTTPSIAGLGTGTAPGDFGLTGKVGIITKYIDNSTNGAADSASNGLADIVYITQLTVAMLNNAPVVDAAGNVTLSTTAGALNQTYAKTAITYPAGMAAKDYFTYVKWLSAADQGTYIQKATKVTGQITGSNNYGTVVTFAGTSYFVADGAVVPASTLANPANQNVAATAWVSADGYIIMCKPDTTASYNVGLVVGYAYTPVSASNLVAKGQVMLYTNDGKLATYDVAADATGIVPNQTASGTGAFTTNATLVTYSFNASNQVTVWPVTDTTNSKVAGAAGTGAGNNVAAYSKQTALVTIGGVAYYLNASTKVIYFDGSKAYAPSGTGKNLAAVQTGFGNTIDILGTAYPTGVNVTYVKDPNNASLLDAIYFNMPAPVGTSGNYAYFTMSTYTLRVVNNVNYYDYNVLVNGATTPKVLTSVGTEVAGWEFGTKGLFSYTVDSNGYVTSATAANGPATTSSAYYKVNYVDSGFVGYTDGTTNRSLLVNADTKYFQVNPATLAVTEALIPNSNAGTSTYIVNYALSIATGNPALYVYYIIV